MKENSVQTAQTNAHREQAIQFLWNPAIGDTVEIAGQLHEIIKINGFSFESQKPGDSRTYVSDYPDTFWYPTIPQIEYLALEMGYEIVSTGTSEKHGYYARSGKFKHWIPEIYSDENEAAIACLSSIIKKFNGLDKKLTAVFADLAYVGILRYAEFEKRHKPILVS